MPRNQLVAWRTISESPLSKPLAELNHKLPAAIRPNQRGCVKAYQRAAVVREAEFLRGARDDQAPEDLRRVPMPHHREICDRLNRSDAGLGAIDVQIWYAGRPRCAESKYDHLDEAQ